MNSVRVIITRFQGCSESVGSGSFPPKKSCILSEKGGPSGSRAINSGGGFGSGRTFPQADNVTRETIVNSPSLVELFLRGIVNLLLLRPGLFDSRLHSGELFLIGKRPPVVPGDPGRGADTQDPGYCDRNEPDGHVIGVSEIARQMPRPLAMPLSLSGSVAPLRRCQR